jgi:hypothetical protein
VPGQILLEDADIFTVGITELMFIVIALLVAVGCEAQDAVLVIITLTTLPFVKLFVVNILLFVPVLMPFTCH